MARAEPCPVPGCPDPKLHGHLMCRDHWRSLPAAIRGAVFVAWKRIREPWNGNDYKSRIEAIVEYRKVCKTAIDWIAAKEGFHEVAR